MGSHQENRLLRKVEILLGVIILLLIAGAAVYSVIESMPFLDALYSVVMVMTGIGSSRDPQTLAGKWFNILLALISVALLISFIAQVGQLLLRREILAS